MNQVNKSLPTLAKYLHYCITFPETDLHNTDLYLDSGERSLFSPRKITRTIIHACKIYVIRGLRIFFYFLNLEQISNNIRCNK